MPKTFQIQDAEIVAIKALKFLADSNEALMRFLTAGTLSPQDLMHRAEEHSVQVAILEFMLSEDTLLLGFCEAEGFNPKEIHQARHVLEGSISL